GLNEDVVSVALRAREVFVGGLFTTADRRASYHFGRWAFDNIAPVVNFRAPAPGQTFIAPAEVPIVVDALDVDGEVRRVDFYADSRLLGTITQGPYGIVWSGAPPGIYTLTARATDNDGAMKTASTIVSIVSSNTPPFVQLTSPSE